MGLLTPTQVAQEQAKAEGFQNGPIPTVNPVNINTQATLGNTVPSVAEPVPYYPPATNLTPNIGLSLQGLGPVEAENMVQIDTVLANGAGGVLKSNTVILNNTQILNSNAASPAIFPVLVPAQGPGTMINLVSVCIEFSPVGGVGYTGLTNDGVFEFALYGSGSLLAFLAQYPTKGFFDQTTNTLLAIATGSGGGEPVQYLPAVMTNTPLVMAIEDSISGGNVGNRLKITCYYTVFMPL